MQSQIQALQIEGVREGAHIHFIGIGGVHMRAHAEQLHNSGYLVTGSDQNESEATTRLRGKGVGVSIGHRPEHVAADTALVVYTAAVQADNAELVSAQAQGIRVMERAVLLGQLMRNYAHPVCFAGTHGKTTATSMAAEIFLAADADPTIAVGGILPSIGGTVRDGGRDVFVVESCEYCDSFLHFFPYIGVILNIEFDHADYFADLDAVYASFRAFADLIPADGTLIVNAGVERLDTLIEGLDCRVLIVDGDKAAVRAENIRYDTRGCASFTAMLGGVVWGEVRLNVPGRHNVSNALAAMTAAQVLRVPFEAMAQGLANFRGSGRRAEVKGTMKTGAVVMDDYAHHPTEIRAALAAMRNSAYKRIFCMFQPHTRTRTLALIDDFSTSFDDADVVVLLDIYEPAGREEHGVDISSSVLAAMLEKRGVAVYYAKNSSDAVSYIQKNSQEGDLCITMGAGDVSQLGKCLLS